MSTLMQTAKTGDPKTVELLSCITGITLSDQDVTPPMLFLTALITILAGVMVADQAVTEEEKQRWQKTINRFIPVQGDVRQLAQLLIKGIREQKIYSKHDQLMILVAPFSKAERLLLVSFGYEMACADNAIDEREKQYLQSIAHVLETKLTHLNILESSLTNQIVSDTVALKEVRFLLDPARFHELDALIISAASDLLDILPTTSVDFAANQHQAVVYQKLDTFQSSRRALAHLCVQIQQITEECVSRELLPSLLADDVEKLSQKLQSQRFRLAILGEFSQGKSTLLNALLGEKIQPVRTIPCSSTVSVLRFGSKKRVICCYKNGRQEEIAVDQYQEVATIPKKEIGNELLTETLLQSEIRELIFEDPALELCQKGIEILDSPGLNEHPNRTMVTYQLLEEADAAIFVANANRPLTQTEQELLQEIKVQLNGGDPNRPADNLFVAVNFFDLVDEESDREDVKQRFEGFLKGRNPVVAGENRIHYISAKSAFNTLLKGESNEYSQSFQQFAQAIEQYLTEERGWLEYKRYVQEIKVLVAEALNGLNQAKNALGRTIELSNEEKKAILEQIGEATGREVKLRLLLEQVFDSTLGEFEESWEQWFSSLGGRLAKKVAQWSSKHSAIWSRDQLIKDYTNQFNKDLSNELNTWIESQLKKEILSPCLKVLDQEIQKESEAIKTSIKSIEKLNKSNSINWVFYTGKDSDPGDFTVLSGFGMAGLGAAIFPVIIFAGPIMAVLGGLVAGGFLGTGAGNLMYSDSEIRLRVFEKGCEEFVSSLEKTKDKIIEIIDLEFQSRLKEIEQVITKAIIVLEKLLEHQEEVYSLNLEKTNNDRTWILERQGKLNNLLKMLS